jgi:dephospho-CoA kinase
MIGGAIDRERLSARGVADRDELEALEKSVHPAVARARARRFGGES